MWRLAASLAIIAALAGLVAGCGSGESAAQAYAARANDWTIPGVLRLESDQSPDNLNPILGQDSIDTDVSMFWAAHLFDWSDKNELVPELATEEPTLANGGISADGRTITYHLRAGVRWQDGAPFDAADVVFSWHAVMNPRNQVVVRSGYDLITAIDTPDPHTAIVHLRHPYAPFVTTFFSMSDTAYALLPAHLLAHDRDINAVAYNRLPVGTGPFRVVSDDGRHVLLVANRDYWRGPPKLREVDFRWARHNSQILDDLKNHRIDFYAQASDHDEPALQGIPGTTIYLYPFNGYETIGFNTRSPILRDVRVRQALAYATDRTELLNRIGNGVDAAADTDQAPFSWAHDDRVRTYPYAPRAARALLDAAGWTVGPDGMRSKGGRRLRIVLSSLAAGPTSRGLVASWRTVGVDAVLQKVKPAALDASAAQGGIEATGSFDAVIDGWVNGTDPDDSSQVMCDMTPPAGWNIYRYCNPRVDADERAALSSYDRATRRAAYDRIQEQLAQDVPFIVLSFSQQQDVVNLDLKNYRPASAVTPFWNTWELDI